MVLPPTTPVLDAAPAVLRPPGPEDRLARLTLGRDPEYERLVGNDYTTDPLTIADAAGWFERLANRPFGWVIEVDGLLVGDACLDHFNLHDRRARFAIGILDPDMRGKGIGTSVTRSILGYGFDVLRLHRIDLRVLRHNTAAIAVYEKCGFRHEGVERQSAYIDGRWHDDLIMGILENEYRRRM